MFQGGDGWGGGDDVGQCVDSSPRDEAGDNVEDNSKAAVFFLFYSADGAAEIYHYQKKCAESKKKEDKKYWGQMFYGEDGWQK